MKILVATLLFLASIGTAERGTYGGLGSDEHDTNFDHFVASDVSTSSDQDSIPINELGPSPRQAQQELLDEKILAEQEELAADLTEQGLQQALTDTARFIQNELDGFYITSKFQLSSETDQMRIMVNSLNEYGSRTTRDLTRRERRLEIAMMHGEYGKCCCDPVAKANSSFQEPRNPFASTKVPACSWSEGAQLLGKFSRKCDRDQLAYTEFLGLPEDKRMHELTLPEGSMLTDEEGSLQDQMLDQCGQTASWQLHSRNQIVNEVDLINQGLDGDIASLNSYLR